MDLILHIGLPKTGTTTIQRALLDEHSGSFVPRGKRNPDDPDTLAHAVGEKDTGPPERSTERLHRAQRWAHEIRDQAQRHDPALRTVVISQEALCDWRARGRPHRLPISMSDWSKRSLRREGNPPIVDFLKLWKDEIWPWGRVRVIFTVRNQPEWLASLYAQLSDRIVRPSQKDFERRVYSLIDTDDPYIQWSHWHAGLVEALGSDNVCTLLTEEIDSPHFWKKLGTFVDPGTTNPDLHKNPDIEENKRNESPGVAWRIRPPHIRRMVMNNWPDNRFNGLRLSTLRFMDKTESLYKPVTRLLFFPVRGRNFLLTDRVRQDILRHVRLSNQRLAEQLGRDLESLGYY
ncbi:hypothetical protein QWY84_09625 [Aquisalimonas lutea]|uniref:hypothetical protein n=1 Tax=Aquisalimonas lutea TaxID=1327750 RepID=UPI0025B4A8BD|nr:hypothetical protein [Aquisalimonas lutea]MDN3517870.1 hypothetical protein [Aquisalimonas lutea]